MDVLPRLEFATWSYVFLQARREVSKKSGGYSWDNILQLLHLSQDYAQDSAKQVELGFRMILAACGGKLD